MHENRLIQKQAGIYYELHHIILRSCGGNDEDYNLVLLTAKEHFIAQALLYKHSRYISGPDQYRYISAFNMMRCSTKDQYRYINSRLYNKLRSDLWTDERRMMARTRMTGANNPMFGKSRSDEVKSKISKSLTGRIVPQSELDKLRGRKLSKKHIEKIRLYMLTNHPFKGKKMSSHTLEHKKKISLAGQKYIYIITKPNGDVEKMNVWDLKEYAKHNNLPPQLDFRKTNNLIPTINSKWYGHKILRIKL